jgi:murein DD-endopeptidase MepM/ murein hydrolase activator NlpD
MAQAWYTATWHDQTGAKNDGYGHTGLDLNLDASPWGDVDRGRPVFAIAPGVIHRVGFHDRYRGCVIQRVEHDGAPLWVRYWHLSPGCMVLAREGLQVKAGQLIGHIGAYPDAGDHLHFDMALDPFECTWWFTRHPDVRFVDPVPVLRQHCIVEELEAMLRKGDTRDG